MEETEMIDALCGESSVARAYVYRAIGDYHGWENLDGYPLTLTREEAEKRYEEEMAHGH
jgi:hypothetical protein